MVPVGQGSRPLGVQTMLGDTGPSALLAELLTGPACLPSPLPAALTPADNHSSLCSRLPLAWRALTLSSLRTRPCLCLLCVERRSVQHELHMRRGPAPVSIPVTQGPQHEQGGQVNPQDRPRPSLRVQPGPALPLHCHFSLFHCHSAPRSAPSRDALEELTEGADPRPASCPPWSRVRRSTCQVCVLSASPLALNTQRGRHAQTPSARSWSWLFRGQEGRDSGC